MMPLSKLMEISDLEINERIRLHSMQTESIEDLLAGGETLETLEAAGLLESQWESPQEKAARIAATQIRGTLTLEQIQAAIAAADDDPPF
jgi:hypothetical protein